MKKWIGLIVVLVLAAAPAWALEEFKPLATLQDAAVATGNGTALDVALYNSVGLEVTIATTATVTFEGTVDGSTWASTVCTATSNTSATLVTSSTATGTYQCGVAGLSKFRARISSWTSGAVTVKARATTALISRRGGAVGGGGLASGDIDTCAEFAAIMGGETGTCGSVVLSQAPTIVSPIFTTSVLLPNGTAVPGTCSIGMIYFDNDATAGVNLYGCTASNTWTLLGDGVGAAAVATDTIWDAAGDLVYGTGANTAVRLAPGTTGQVLTLGTGPVAPAWSSTLTALTSISFGADPGDGSPLNLSNNTCINWEIATPGTDKCLKVNASDQLDFNGTINLSGAGTGSVVINGVTSGSLTITGADAMAQAVTVTVAAQTTGAAVLTIPDRAGSNGTFAFVAGDIGAATATTPSANDNDTSVATTAYVQTELTAYASDTVTLTNKTLDAEGTGNVVTIPRRIWLPAAGCNNATAGSVWDLPTSNPAVAACVTGTNTQKGVLNFADSADLSAQITYKLPSTWTGTVDANIKWYTAATSGDVVWQIQTICVADAETDDPAFNTASTVTDTAKGTTLQTNDAAITTVTVTGCAASELMHVKIRRDSAHASDSLASTASLIGVELVIREAM